MFPDLAKLCKDDGIFLADQVNIDNCNIYFITIHVISSVAVSILKIRYKLQLLLSSALLSLSLNNLGFPQSLLTLGSC